MKSFWIFILSSWVFLSLVVTAYAGQCLMVSGIQKDWNGAFSNEEWHKLDAGAGVIAGRKCMRVNSWSEVDGALKKMKLGKHEDLLIVQGAHGGPGGSMTCNLGSTTEGEVVYGKLKRLAQDRRLGVYIQSCFSGDLLRHKLLDDLIDPSKATDQLCLWPITTFNNPNDADAVKQVAQARPGQSMTELYQSMPQNYAGLFSGSLWSDWGLDVHFLKQDQASLVKTWQGLSNIMVQCGGHDTYRDNFLKLPQLPKEKLEAIVLLHKYSDEMRTMSEQDLISLIGDLEKSNAANPVLKLCQKDLAQELRQTNFLQMIQKYRPDGPHYLDTVLYKYSGQVSTDPDARGIIFRDLVNGVFRFTQKRPECDAKDWQELTQKLNFQAIEYQANYGQSYLTALKQLATFEPAQPGIKSAAENPHLWVYLLETTLSGMNESTGSYGQTGALITKAMVDQNYPDRQLADDVRWLTQTISKHTVSMAPKSQLDRRRRKACDNFVF